MFKTKLAREIWETKYKFGDETPLQTFERVARALASVEKNPDEWYDKFLHTLVRFNSDGDPIGLKCTTGGRITANIGTSFTKATLLNCFVSSPVANAKISYKKKTDDGSIQFPIEYSTPDTPDDLINIFLTITEQAKTLASEGGYGLNFDFIRPRGSLIKGTGIRHPGVVAYMKIWDSVSQCIVQGDTDGYVDKIKNHLKSEEKFQEIKEVVKNAIRKGAMLAALSVTHPDCEEFVRAKQASGVLTKFNISVVLTDDFLKAVEEDSFFEQSFNGVVYKKIKAKDLYSLIMQSCYDRAEPGVLYADNMMRNNPIAYIGRPTACNPCGEIPGVASIGTVCLLGSLNLPMYVKKTTEGPRFDFDEYSEDIKVFMRMLDNVNDMTYAPLPAYQWVVDNLRQIGMGVNGLGSALLMLGIPYNSQEAVLFTKKVCQIKENLTWQISAKLAHEKGTFGVYKKELFESTEYFNSDRITDKTREMLRKYGARNAKTTTVPPLGNSSIISDVTSNGIEPVFLLEYERKVICQGWPAGLTADNIKNILEHYKEKDFEYWRGPYESKEYYYEPHNRGLCEINVVRDYGYQWLLDNYPEKDHNKYLITTKDLRIEDHLQIQQVVQYYNNQSTSKTCNLSNDYPFEEFKQLYLKAWKLGLNGFTTYREGSMESVLSDINKASKREIISKDIKLPDVFINGPTHIIKREGKKFYLHFSYLPDDSQMKFPVVIWIYTNAKYQAEELRVCNKAARNMSKLALDCGISRELVKETVDKANQDYPHNRLGRMVSLCLRHNIPREDILVSLMGIDGDNVSTLLTAVRKFLSKTLADGVLLKGLKCPKCGGRVITEGGCQRCIDCPDYSACG
jgi:ribonucleoside-diphosphate reductase alpha chain